MTTPASVSYLIAMIFGRLIELRRRNPSLADQIMKQHGLEEIHLACSRDDPKELAQCLRRGDAYRDISPSLFGIASAVGPNILSQLVEGAVEGFVLSGLEIPTNILESEHITDTIVTKALALGADPNTKGHSGIPLLHRAIVRRLSLNTIQELINRGADIHSLHKGETALDISRKGNPSAVLALLRAGANWTGDEYFAGVFNNLRKHNQVLCGPELLAILMNKGYRGYTSNDVETVLDHYVGLNFAGHISDPKRIGWTGRASANPGMAESAGDYQITDVLEMIRCIPANCVRMLTKIPREWSGCYVSLPRVFLLTREIEKSVCNLTFPGSLLPTRSSRPLGLRCYFRKILFKIVTDLVRQSLTVNRLLRNPTDRPTKDYENVWQAIVIRACTDPSSVYREKITLTPAEYRYLSEKDLLTVKTLARCRTLTQINPFREMPNDIFFIIISLTVLVRRMRIQG